MFLAQGPQRSDAGEARTHGPRSRVKHSTTEPLRSFFLSIFTGSLIYEHYTRECEFGNFDKIKNKKHKKTKQHKKTQKLLAEFLFK